nr:COP9 signalosome complex subunit 8 isoform X4 [Symphalangus syndactylus]
MTVPVFLTSSRGKKGIYCLLAEQPMKWSKYLLVNKCHAWISSHLRTLAITAVGERCPRQWDLQTHTLPQPLDMPIRVLICLLRDKDPGSDHSSSMYPDTRILARGAVCSRSGESGKQKRRVAFLGMGQPEGVRRAGRYEDLYPGAAARKCDMNSSGCAQRREECWRFLRAMRVSHTCLIA